MTYLTYIALIIIGFIIGRLSKTTSVHPATKEEMKEIRNEAQEALSNRTEERKAKILEMMKNEAEHQKELAKCQITDKEKGTTRQDVEEFLDVSKATALKYLNELEAEGKIQQNGTTSKNVYYTLK